MKSKIVFWLLVVCVVSPPLCAQQNQKLDSLLTLYQNLDDGIRKYEVLAQAHELTLYNDIDAAKNYVDLSVKLARQLDYKKGIAQSNYNLGVYYNNIGKKDSAFASYKKSLQQYIAIKDISGETAVRHGLAILKFAESDYDKALNLIEENIEIQSVQRPIDSSRLASSFYLKGYTQVKKANYKVALVETLKALKIFERIAQPDREADAIALLGEIEYHLGNIDQSLEYDKKSLAIYRRINDKFYEAESMLTIADTYMEIKEYDTAMDYLNDALPLAREIQSPSIETMILGALGDIATEKGEYYKAISYIKASTKISKEAKRPAILGENWLSTSLFYSKVNQPKIAIQYLDSTLQNAKSTGNKDLLQRAYFDGSKLYSELGNHKQAYAYYVDFHNISDSILNSDKSKQIEELRSKFDTEKKEQQIVLQEKEITVLEQQASISNLQRILMGIGLLLSLIGFYAIRQKMKRNRLEKEKVDAELEFKKKELTTHALNLARKNETLENLKLKAQELKEKENMGEGYNQLIRSINFDLQDDNNWENFSRYFEEVHKDFNSNVKNKYPGVTSNELRLLALLKMNLSSKEIANILNISGEGIKKARYRLRKKMDLTTEDSLQDLVLNL